MIEISKISKPNFIDLSADLIIACFIGKRFGLAVGFWAFSISVTLNQILWAICELIRKGIVNQKEE